MNLKFLTPSIAVATIALIASSSVVISAQTLAHDVWIAVRTDGKPGTGTIIDPYDGSTAAKFDSIMGDITKTPANTIIHLGPGTFPTNGWFAWNPRPGWVVQGAGMYDTTVQFVKNDIGTSDSVVFASQYNAPTDNVTLRDFTIDCNWGGVANGATTGATVRTFTTTAGSTSSPTVTSTNGSFTALDIGRIISGPGIPPNSWIGIVNSPSSLGLSSSAVSNVPVNATIASGATVTIAEKNVKVMAASIGGSNNMYERLRAIHNFGSWQNGRECFVMSIFAPQTVTSRDFTNNTIRFCLVEDGYGNYANPFAMGGSDGGPSYPGIVNKLANSTVEFCAAYGKQGPVGYQFPGSVSPFTSGGVNLAEVRDINVRNNYFEDCYAAAYQDTGGYTGIEVSDNTLVRGWAGVGFGVDPANFPSATFRGLSILRNRLGIQRRVLGGANYGISVQNDCWPVIDGNLITYDPDGPGTDVFWPMQIVGTNGTITNNAVDLSPETIAHGVYVLVGNAGTTNGAPDSRYQISNNRTLVGSTISGVTDTVVNEGLALSDVWIAIRTDGLNGSGTQTDPYDGSTPAGFDAVMASMPAYTRIHLGAGTFRTAATHSWVVRTGWVVEGAGIDSTTVQLAGSPASGISRNFCFSSPNTTSTDNVIMRNFSVDSNWWELSIASIAPIPRVVNFSASGIYIFGSNNLVEDVKSINTIGSSEYLNECFGIALATPVGSVNPSTGNVIRFCHAEKPFGDYAAPFALHGCANSSVYDNEAIGGSIGFNAGGVDGIGLTNCEIYNNTFIDCLGAFYGHAGSFDNVKVSNNTVVRGWLCAAFTSAQPKQNIQISGNSFLAQNLFGTTVNNPIPAPLIVNPPLPLTIGASYGIVVTGGPSNNVMIFNNDLTFDPTGGFVGSGVSESWGIATSSVVTGVIANNTVEQPNNLVLGVGVTFFNNRQPDGTFATGL